MFFNLFFEHSSGVIFKSRSVSSLVRWDGLTGTGECTGTDGASFIAVSHICLEARGRQGDKDRSELRDG